jgi:putative tryptophan/tyrosine transport system substrate-binding protein
MKRRDFITLLGGAAGAWPLAARAQPRDPAKRIAWVGTRIEDTEVFGNELSRLGWAQNRDIRISYRVETDNDRVNALAPEIVAAAPDLIVTVGTDYSQTFKRLTDTIPIVFIQVADPVASGLVESFAKPGKNVTGFSNLQFSLGGKWLALLKDFVPDAAAVMVLYEPANANWRGFLPVIEAAAPSFQVTVRPAPATEVAEVARHIETFGRDTRGVMIVLPTALTVGQRETIATLAARHRLPAIYPLKFFATSGGLVSYGSNTADLTRRAAQYADRILRGEKPADLPVQAPIRFELVINLKTARALGLDVPASLLAQADEVIE